MLRFMIKLPFRIIAAPVWLVLAAVNIVLVFLVGLSAGFCYLIAGISVVTEVLSIGFGIVRISLVSTLGFSTVDPRNYTNKRHDDSAHSHVHTAR